MGSIEWSRLGIEAVTIVGAILLAFAIEAWWDDWQQDRDEQIVLESLLGSVVEKKSTLQEYRVYIENILGAVVRLKEATDPDRRFSGSDEADVVMDKMLWSSLLGVSEAPALSALFSGGGVSEIDNQMLLQELVELRSSLIALNNVVEGDVKFFHQDLMPFMHQRANLTQIQNVSAGMPHPSNVHTGTIILHAGEKQDHLQLIDDKVFQNLQLSRIWHLQNTQAVLDTIEPQLQKSIDSLRAELN